MVAKVGEPLIFQLRPVASRRIEAVDRSAFRRAPPPPPAPPTRIASTEIARQLAAAEASVANVLLSLRSGASLKAVRTDVVKPTPTVQSGSFNINDVTIGVNVSTDSLASVASRISSSAAGVTASFDANEKKLILTSNTAGAVVINNDSSGFVAAAKLGLFQDPFDKGSLTSLNEALGSVRTGSVRTKLLSALRDALESTGAQAKGLSLLEAEGTAKLAVDEKKLAETLKNNPDALDALFSKSATLEGALATALKDNDRSDILRVKPAKLVPTPALKLAAGSKVAIKSTVDNISVALAAAALETPPTLAETLVDDDDKTGNESTFAQQSPALKSGLLAAARRAYSVDAPAALSITGATQFKLIR